MVRKTRCHFCGKRYSYDDLYDVKICHECNRHELAIWVDIKERLPKVIMKDGVCNVVLVKYKIAPECGSKFQTSNTAYINKYPEKFTRWMPIPETPENEKE